MSRARCLHFTMPWCDSWMSSYISFLLLWGTISFCALNNNPLISEISSVHGRYSFSFSICLYRCWVGVRALDVQARGFSSCKRTAPSLWNLHLQRGIMAYLDHSNQGLVLRRPSAFSSCWWSQCHATFLYNNSFSGAFPVAMFGINFPRYWMNPRNVFSSLAFSGGFISFTALIFSGSGFKPSLLRAWPT